MNNLQIRKNIEDYLERYNSIWALSGAILVAKGGKVIFEKAYGMANFEHEVPNTLDTKFLIGSITKSFTAVAIMMLEERGLLDVNDSIRKYLPDYPEIGDKITLYNLLTHTSGIPTFTLLPGFLGKLERMYLTQEEVIDLFKDKELEFEPGEKGNYTNSGYYLLGVIIEKITGQTYAEFLQENMFDPLKMENTGLYHQKMILPKRASGYDLNGGKFERGNYVEMPTTFSAGSIYSTLKDMFTWEQALHAGKMVSKATLERMFTPYQKIDGSIPYGCGFFVTELCNRKRVGHEGGLHGFLSQLYHFVEDDVCIIYLANKVQNIWTIGNVLPVIIFGEEYKLPEKLSPGNFEPGILERYVGAYGRKKPAYKVTTEDNKLFFQIEDGDRFELAPISETKFTHKLYEEYYEFVRDNDGDNFELIYYGHRLKKWY